MHTVMVIGVIHDAGMAILRARDDVKVVAPVDFAPNSLAESVADADAIIVRTQPLPKDVLARAKRLRVVSRHGVGHDNVDLSHLSARGIPLAIAADANYTAVAEHTLMMILCLAKDAFAADRAVRADDFAFRDRGSLSDVAEKRILLMGLGRIGRRVAELCLAFDMRVSAYDPHAPVGDASRIKRVDDFRVELPQADYVSLHLPPGPAGTFLLGEEEFKLFKPGAFLVNCARGGLVDEAALAGAIRSGRLAGAGMDVFLDEPPRPDNPLFGLGRCLFSPHAAALSRECAERTALQTVRNALAALDGELDPRVVVNAQAIGWSSPSSERK